MLCPDSSEALGATNAFHERYRNRISSSTVLVKEYLGSEFSGDGSIDQPFLTALHIDLVSACRW